MFRKPSKNDIQDIEAGRIPPANGVEIPETRTIRTKEPSASELRKSASFKRSSSSNPMIVDNPDFDQTSSTVNQVSECEYSRKPPLKRNGMLLTCFHDLI